MPLLYILRNKNNKHYIGITNLDPEKRLQRHNKGDVYSTRLGRPWKIIYLEMFRTLGQARIKEKKIKSWKGGNAFKNFLFKAAGSSNGRTMDSGSINPGSSPGPAALKRNDYKFGGVK